MAKITKFKSSFAQVTKASGKNDTEIDFAKWLSCDTGLISVGDGIHGITEDIFELIAWYKQGISLADKIKQSATVSQQNGFKKSEQKKEGWVYVIKSSGKIKIGISKSKHSRLKKYITENPDPIETIHTFWCDDCRKKEVELHEKFKEKHFRGEWFLLDATEIEYLKSL